jgi:FMN phosphatase YigB (HAD superfamily)
LIELKDYPCIMQHPTFRQQVTTLLQFTPEEILHQDDSDSDSDCEDETVRKTFQTEKKMNQVHLHGMEAFRQWNEAYAMFMNQFQLTQFLHQTQMIQVNQLLEKTENEIKLQEENIALHDEIARLKAENVLITNQRDKQENRAEHLVGVLQWVQEKVQDHSIIELIEEALD